MLTEYGQMGENMSESKCHTHMYTYCTIVMNRTGQSYKHVGAPHRPSWLYADSMCSAAKSNPRYTLMDMATIDLWNTAHIRCYTYTHVALGYSRTTCPTAA
jgi:hypothetical protein